MKWNAKVIGLVAVVLAGAPSLGLTSENDELSQGMGQLDTHMAQMQRDMVEIEGTRDSDERNRKLGAHMRNMERAMEMMRQDLMPKMKRRLHSHKQPSSSLRDRSASPDMVGHVDRMEEMMAHMDSLIAQMSQHRQVMGSE